VRGPRDRRRPAAKLVVGLVVGLLVVAGVSYAAVRPALHAGDGTGTGPERHAPPSTPIKAPTQIPVVATDTAALRIVGHPPALSTSTTARFRVVAEGEPELRCRLDGRPAQPCPANVTYRGLGAGGHRFYVAAREKGKKAIRADFGWRVLEPEPFEVEPRPASVGPLYPGGTPVPIRVVISNPNEVAITVTSLRVMASGGADGCSPKANVALTAPDLGETALRIPANGSLTLPSAKVAAPTIALRELGVNQDACQGAKFDLSFSGSAGA
jgi:hypothetical protein